MATIIETLAVKLVGDVDDFEQKLDGAEKQVTSFGDKMTAIGGKMQQSGALMTAGITVPLLAIGAKAADAASDLEESMNKVNVVFGESAEKIVAWSDGSAQALGQSQQQAIEATGTFGNLFTSMGIGVEKSAEMSMGMVTLASDLASFNNIDPTIALEKLRAGLVGEAEPLRTLGVNLTAATIEAKALELGLGGTAVNMDKVHIATEKLSIAQQVAAEALAKHGESSLQYQRATLAVDTAQQSLEKALAGTNVTLTAAEKAQGAYALILEQTKNAQGDFARTADGAANAERILNAQLQDGAAKLGAQVLPMKLKLIEATSSLVKWFMDLSPTTQKWIVIIGTAVAVIGPLLIVLGSLITAIGVISSALVAAGPVIAAAGAAIAGLSLPITLVIAAVAALAVAWYNDWGGIRGYTYAVWADIKSVSASAMQALRDLFTGSWSEIGSRMMQGIADGIKAGWQWVVDAATGAANAALGAAKAALGIASPSKVAAEEIGEPFADGVNMGMQRRWALNGAGAMDGLMGQFSAVGAGAGGPMTVQITNHFNGNVDQQAVARGTQDGLVAGLRQVGLR